jgi:hypothetical protein
MNRFCIVCVKPLVVDEHCEFGSTIPAVYDATVWRTHGNYGSTKFDPMGPPGSGDEFLEAYICDACLVEKGNLIFHLDIRKPKLEEVKVCTFNEHEEAHPTSPPSQAGNVHP